MPDRLRALMRTGTASTALVALALLSVFAVIRHFHGFSMVDMLVYRAEGAAVANGQDLYAMRLPGWNLPATYPPFAAMLFVPATWFDISVLRVVVTLANIALLALLVHLSFRLVGWPRPGRRAPALLLAVGAGVFLEPVYTTLQYGQINLVIACLVLWDLTHKHRFTGIGIGLAIGIKLTPGIFAVYLLLTGRIRAAMVSGATFLVTALIGTVALPGASYGFWTTYLWDSTRVGRTEIVDNQAISGALARLLHTEHPGFPATAVAGLVAIGGLALATRSLRGGAPRAEAWGVVCTAITALLISPISWTHHWIWCVPLLVLLTAEAAQRSRRLPYRAVLALVVVAFLSRGMWMVPHKNGLELQLSPWEHLGGEVYVLVGFLVLVLAVLRAKEPEPVVNSELVVSAVEPSQGSLVAARSGGE
ncbi:glycosyltransferase 87 family protein [Kitasatospora sp. NBC_00070]|uniref:glycosyltransferase 87 family protein n=1 Tax=Kitasatospora sp. NBC_00070 TaxID=2975962 RepID=UPI00324D4388